MSVPQLILSVSLNGAGHHPGAWRMPHASRAQALGGAHYRDMAQLAERGRFDFALLGYPPRGSALAPPGSAAYNPAFDVTPAALITALVTEEGVAEPVTAGNLRLLHTRSGARDSARTETSMEL